MNYPSDQLLELQNRTSAAAGKRLAFFGQFSSPEHASIIGAALYCEYSIHTFAIGRVLVDLFNELSRWWAAHKKRTDRISPAEELALQSAVTRIEQCVKVLEMNNLDQLTRLGKIVLDAAVAYFELELLKHLFELLAIVTRRDPGTDPRMETTARVLSELELFCGIGLLASQIAVQHVHALTTPLTEEQLNEKSIEERAKDGMRAARSFVAARLREQRESTRASLVGTPGELALRCRFPEDGLWPTRLPARQSTAVTVSQ